MRIFIWKRIKEGLTYYDHSGGGLVVVAESLPAALVAAGAQTASTPSTLPDAVYNVEDSVPEAVYVFPDAGCC